MTTVLGIQGSPRKHGNTQILVERVLDGARDAGATTHMLQLADMTIGECDGCHACWQGKECPKDDDMNDVYAQIAGADALVFGSPVYWFGPTALMKAFIDRFVYFNCPENRAKIKGKRAALVVPFEDDALASAAPLVKVFDMSLAYVEMQLAEPLLVPGVGRKGAVLERPADLDAAYALGQSLVS
jgi:multimeric flavodoxin WrbA